MESMKTIMGKFLYFGAKQKSSKLHKPAPFSPKKSTTRLVTSLTCLQFAFATYATLLLFYISPALDLRSMPDFTWATQIAKNWKNFIVTPHFVNTNLTQDDSSSHLMIHHVMRFTKSEVCESEKIDFEQKKSADELMIKLKREMYEEVRTFQDKSFGTETLSQLMGMKSKWDLNNKQSPKITVILNHFKRKTLCSQLNSLLNQTLPFHHVWVLSFGSPNELSLRRIVESYNDSRISFISSTYDFKYFGRFQMALQTEADFVYILDDDMIPGTKMLRILAHVAGTEKYKNTVLGSIGRILPFRQKDFMFPSYRKFRSKEAGIYLPDPAYNIIVDKIVQVDFLSSSWFLSTELVKTLFIEDPSTFMTGEDLHLRGGYVALYPNFPRQASFSTNHMEPGAHISAKENVVRHDKSDFEVPLLKEDFSALLPAGKLPPASKLPALNLFNQPVSLRGLKAAGGKLSRDVLNCTSDEIVIVDHQTGLPNKCSRF